MVPFLGPFRANPPLSCKETAVATTYETPPTDFNLTDANAGNPIPKGDAFLVMFREVGRNTLMYFANTGGSVWSYQSTAKPPNGVVEPELGVDDFVPINYLSALNAFEPHGPKQWPQDGLDGEDAHWVDTQPNGSLDPPTTITFTCAGLTPLTDTASFIIRRVIGSYIFDFAVSGFLNAGGALIFTPAAGTSGYYSYRLASTNAAVGGSGVFTSVVVKVSGQCAVVGHRAVPKWADYEKSPENIGVNALSAMYTNTAAPLARSGKVVTLQVPGGVDWPALFGLGTGAAASIPLGGTPSTWETIGELAGAVTKEVVNGAYLYAKAATPETYKRFPMRYGEYPPLLPITPQDDYILIYVSIPAAAASSARDGYWTPVASTEYETLDQTRERDLPSVRCLDFIDAHDRIAKAAQHHANAFHLKDLLGAAAGAILNPVGSTASIAGNVLGQLLG